jgi:hypothetical protein
MGELNNQFVSSSYQGLLKMTDSTNGLTNTLQTVQSGNGVNGPLQMSTTAVNISGSFFINNVPVTGTTSGTSGTSGAAGSNGTSGTSGSSGTSGVGFVIEGDWDSVTNYVVNDIVYINGNSYVAIQDNVNKLPQTYPNFWQIFSAAGSNGTSGTSGASGSSGSNGSDGSSGTSGDSLFALTGSVWSTTNNLQITGSLFVSSSQASDVVINGQLYVSSSSTNNANAPKIIVSGSGGNTTINRNSVNVTTATNVASLNPTITYISDVATLDEIGYTVDTVAGGVSGWTKGAAIYTNDPTDSFPAMIGFQNKANYTNGTVTILNGLDVSGSVDITGQYLVNGVPFSVDRNGLITTGSLGTSQDISGSLNLFGGNTLFQQTGQTLPNQVTQSLGGANILFGLSSIGFYTEDMYTGSLTISGSNNIVPSFLLNPYEVSQAPDGGYKWFISGSNNIINSSLGGAGLALNNDAIAKPSFNSNFGPGIFAITLTSSSLAQPQIQNNITLVNSRLNHPSGSFVYSNNVFNIPTFQSTQNYTPGKNRQLIQNNIGGGMTLNHISSSINFQNNIGQGITVNNHVSSSFTAANNGIGVSNNNFNGVGHVIYASGSSSSSQLRLFNQNLIGGGSNVISSSYVGSNNAHLISNITFGQNLMVSASNSNASGGSAFFGRFNATGSFQESTNETVFVVGTGTGAGNRRNALRIDNSNNSNFTGSVNISGSLTLNGVTVGDGNRNGLITTGSYNGLQIISSSLLVANTSNAGHPPLLQAQAWSFSQNAASFTGVTNITGSLIVNGATITAADRNGLITTGSAGATQNISGSLNIDGSSVRIVGTNPGDASNTFSIISGSMKMGDPSGSLRIATQNNQPQLFFNADRRVGFFLGQCNMDQVNTQFGITDDSTDNYTMGGNFNNFRTGSNNLMLAINNISLRSGSYNTIFARDTNYNTGSNNLILGRGPQGINECQEYFNLQLPNSNDPIMFKSGSANPLTIPGLLSVTGGITGSVNINGNVNVTGNTTMSDTVYLNRQLYFTGSNFAANLQSNGVLAMQSDKTFNVGNFGVGGYYNSGSNIYMTVDTGSLSTSFQMIAGMSGTETKINVNNGYGVREIVFDTDITQIKSNTSITGSVNITGQYLVNGVPITGSGGGDRNGLITTGSVITGKQSITGSLLISGSNNLADGGTFAISGSQIWRSRNNSTGESTDGNFNGGQLEISATGVVSELRIYGNSDNMISLNSFGTNNTSIIRYFKGIANYAQGTYIGTNDPTSGYSNFLYVSSSINTGVGNYMGFGSDKNKSNLGNYVFSNVDNSQAKVYISGSLSAIGDIKYASGSNKTMGTVALDGANPGAATVSNSLVTTGSLIFLTKQTLNHPNGYVAVSSKGTGTFSITSNHNGDSDTVAYQIINPA